MPAKSETPLLARLGAPRTLLTLGIGARLLVFAFLRPANNDGHFEVIQFLAAHGRLALPTEVGEAYHPPLYYLLAAPFLEVFGTEKGVQLLSLALSMASLFVLYNVIRRSGLIPGGRAQLYSLFLVCLLPQFVMFSLYVSNDTLAIFFGALIVWQSQRFIQTAELEEGLALAMFTGLGLLTKATFLAFVPVLLALVLFRLIKDGAPMKAAWMASGFLAIVLIVGSYKFVDNYLRFHNPFISFLDAPPHWVAEQNMQYMGLRSYLDINILHLLRWPTLLRQGGTATAFPVLAYATFWYQYIPESNFVGNQHAPFKYLGSLIYMAGMVPTAVFGIGLAGLSKNFPRFIRTFDARDAEACRVLSLYAAVCLLLFNCALIFYLLLKYHHWSFMQARLLFPSLAGALGAFGAGVEIVRRRARAAVLLEISMDSLAVLFGLYLSSEIAYQLLLRYVPAINGVLKSF